MVKIYTKEGDSGKTSFYQSRIGKDSLEIEVIGSLDELNSIVGLAICFIPEEKIKQILVKIQNDLFILGADLGRGKLTSGETPKVNQQHIHEMERLIDELQEKLGLPRKFILPGGTVSSSFLHLCRTTTRRVERNLVSLKKNTDFNSEILSYVNRLSDLFYVLARHTNKELDVHEQQPIYKYFGD